MEKKIAEKETKQTSMSIATVSNLNKAQECLNKLKTK